MKMKVIDRILLGAYAFVSALALIALLVCVVSPGAALALMNMGFGARIFLCVLLAALIAGAVYLIMLSFRPEGSAPSSSASVQESSEGSVRVSVRAMETLARRAIEHAAKVLELTDQIVQKHRLTTLMITHNMKDAIAHGNRLIMMHEGRVIIDVCGEEKKKLTVEQLLSLFNQASGGGAVNDRMILS